MTRQKQMKEDPIGLERWSFGSHDNPWVVADRPQNKRRGDQHD